MELKINESVVLRLAHLGTVLAEKASFEVKEDNDLLKAQKLLKDFNGFYKEVESTRKEITVKLDAIKSDLMATEREIISSAKDADVKLRASANKYAETVQQENARKQAILTARVEFERELGILTRDRIPQALIFLNNSLPKKERYGDVDSWFPAVKAKWIPILEAKLKEEELPFEHLITNVNESIVIEKPKNIRTIKTAKVNSVEGWHNLLDNYLINGGDAEKLSVLLRFYEKNPTKIEGVEIVETTTVVAS